VQLAEWDMASDEALRQQLQHSHDLGTQLELLTVWAQRHGLEAVCASDSHGQQARVQDMLEEVYSRAADGHHSAILRRCAGL